jgi:membrane protease YdiL (CAAX protease family)
MVKAEGRSGVKEIIQALNIKPFSKNDWAYSIIGLLLVFAFTGLIFGISFLLNKYFGIKSLTTTPWFIEINPFQGHEKFLLLIWLPMFFFNIVGEEILWRGYIQTRLQGKYSWMLCSFLWLLFHLPFGLDLMIMLIPVIIIIPYVFSKTKNSLAGIFIHGIYNGPLFILVALGLIKQ